MYLDRRPAVGRVEHRVRPSHSSVGVIERSKAVYRSSEDGSGIQVVAPAAGKGTRPRPLTAEKPTALVDIADEPIPVYCFDELPDIDADEAPVRQAPIPKGVGLSGDDSESRLDRPVESACRESKSG